MFKKRTVRIGVFFSLVILLVIASVFVIQKGTSSGFTYNIDDIDNSDIIDIKERIENGNKLDRIFKNMKIPHENVLIDKWNFYKNMNHQRNSILFKINSVTTSINNKKQLERSYLYNLNKEFIKNSVNYESESALSIMYFKLMNKKLPESLFSYDDLHNHLYTDWIKKPEQPLNNCDCDASNQQPVVEDKKTAKGLSKSDISALQKEGEVKGWTFTVDENSATKRSLDNLCGLVEPEDWWVNAKFDPCLVGGDLPDSFDWRDVNGTDYTTPIKDQGFCGSCWAFATVGPLECNIKIKDNKTVNLSEQWLVSCNRDGWGCNGGWEAHDYHQWKIDPCGDTGAVLEEDFPYEANNSPCGCPYNHSYKISTWAYIGKSYGVPSVNSIKQAIMDYGPIFVCVAADAAFHAYDGGIFNANSSSSINHAVVLVGWNDSQGANGVWFLRNSWGTNWGENGYMRIEYFCNRVGYGACYIDYPGSIPNMTSTICGYITDSNTSLPIKGVFIDTYWYDNQSRKYGNSTKSDISGFYTLNVAEGQINFEVEDVPGYFPYYSPTLSLEDNETYWLNITLTPIPPENSLVLGYVTNKSDGSPIEDAWVDLYWHDEYYHWNWNYTFTDSSGFYWMNVAKGEIQIDVYADGYFSNWTDWYTIGEYEILWINVSLDPRPPENSIVCGFVINESDGSPYEDAWVDLYWQDDYGHYDWNFTFTDSSGFYWMNVAAGNISVSVYPWVFSGWISIREYQIMWLNFTIDDVPPKLANLTYPEYVGLRQPGNISIDVTDKALQQVLMALVDYYNTTFDQRLIIWYYVNITGLNGTYSVRDYNGMYARLEQDKNSSAATVFLFSNWTTEKGRIYTLGYFKKNQTSPWIQIFLEFNLSDNSLTNLVTPINYTNETLEMINLTYLIEPGVSIINNIVISYDEGLVDYDPFVNFTLYNIGDPKNPFIQRYPLSTGRYTGIISAQDKSYNYNMTSFDLKVDNNVYNLTGTVYYEGTESGDIYVLLFYENYSDPVDHTILFSPGEYAFQVPNGTYYLAAWLDVNDDMNPDIYTEPLGYAINNTLFDGADAIYVSGSDSSGVDITLYEPLKPEISNVQAYPSIQEGSGYVNISCNVTCYFSVDEVYLYIMYPYGGDENFSITQNNTEDIYYCNRTYTDNGTYSFFIWANDTAGNGNISSMHHFWICENISTYLSDVGENTINASNIDTLVIINTSTPTNITFIDYAENPYPQEEPANALDKYIDIEVENWDAVIPPLNITIYYTQDDLDDAGITEDQLIGIYFWNETSEKWQLYNVTGVNTTYNQSGYEGYCWAEAWHLTPLTPGGDNEPPSRVTGLKVTDAKDGKLSLSWNAASDNVEVDHYKIYRDGGFLINTTATSYQDKGLTNGQSYSYQVSAVDTSGNEGEKSESKSGTPTESDGGNGGDGGDEPPSGPPPGPLNTPPTADASAGEPYLGFVGEEITFDGSRSSDSDGEIVSWTWDFGDGEYGSGKRVRHAYSDPGTYTVVLTVEDNAGAEDTDETTAVITKANRIPTAPDVDGPQTGTQNTEYTYTAVSTDGDNDTIQYHFAWDDGTNNITEFVPNGTAVTQSHMWTAAGKYTIKVLAFDNQTPSYVTHYTVLIDALLIEDIGYITDNNSDGTYDTFHGDDIDTELGKEGSKYLIDSNGDGKWNYTYSLVEGLSVYEESEDIEIPWIMVVGIVIALAIIAIIVYLFKKEII